MTSMGDEPFQLCTWNGSSDNVRLLDVRFHRSMKPTGVVAFSSGDERNFSSSTTEVDTQCATTP